MDYIVTTMSNLLQQTAFCNLTFGNFLMIGVALVFLMLAIKYGFEPLLLVPIAFGMLLVNIYPDIMARPEDMSNGVGGLLHYFFLFPMPFMRPLLESFGLSVVPLLVFAALFAIPVVALSLCADYVLSFSRLFCIFITGSTPSKALKS